MIEIVGLLVIWGVVGLALIYTPVIIGSFISDRKKDDGKAMYLSLPIAQALGILYLLSTFLYFVVT